jgi:hypothetical protein
VKQSPPSDENAIAAAVTSAAQLRVARLASDASFDGGEGVPRGGRTRVVDTRLAGGNSNDGSAASAGGSGVLGAQLSSEVDGGVIAAAVPLPSTGALPSGANEHVAGGAISRVWRQRTAATPSLPSPGAPVTAVNVGGSGPSVPTTPLSPVSPTVLRVASQLTPTKAHASASKTPATLEASKDGATELSSPVNRFDPRRRVHAAVPASEKRHSNLPVADRVLADMSTPSMSWRGLRVRIGCAPLHHARLHLFGLQSFRDYLASCGSSQKGSALAFDYIGPDVNRAARIAAAARGGEVLVPRSMLEQLPIAVSRHLSTVPIGAVFLKGIGSSGELYSVLPKGLARVFSSTMSSTHCEKCYGLLTCNACEADDDRLGDWVGAVD